MNMPSLTTLLCGNPEAVHTDRFSHTPKQGESQGRHRLQWEGARAEPCSVHWKNKEPATHSKYAVSI